MGNKASLILMVVLVLGISSGLRGRWFGMWMTMGRGIGGGIGLEGILFVGPVRFVIYWMQDIGCRNLG